MKGLVVSFLVNIALQTLVQCKYDQPQCDDGRHVIVHLFNWKHSDIAQECENWLGPKGYCAVQVSPPHEHALYSDADPSVNRPWWERYQPVSYILGSRSGDRTEFEDMVSRCNAVGVRIYADMVINHMASNTASGIGSAGSAFDASTLMFPDYDETDFNCCSQNGQGNCDDGKTCPTESCNIESYTDDPEQIRDCRLVGLVDLAVGIQEPRDNIRGYFDDLIDIGVTGFRVDACKHMWPEDLSAMYDGMVLPDGSEPFIYNEVIDLEGNGEPITGEEYFELGRVTEFNYCNHLFGFRGNFPLADYETFGEDWGMYPSGNALVFVDNHDNQRGHGAGGAEIITFWEPRIYKMATTFALAHPYGHVRIMSSYRWPEGRFDNDGYGPPTNDGDDIKDVTINADNSCDDGSEHTWVCEHRWRSIVNMVEWRNVVGGEGSAVENWWSNGNNQIAFSRNGAGFIAFNNETSDMSETLTTGLPAGEYCNIIKADADDCAENMVTVNEDGTALINIPAADTEPMVAIHTGSASLIRKYDAPQQNM